MNRADSENYADLNFVKDYSREGKRLFASRKNQQTFKFSEGLEAGTQQVQRALARPGDSYDYPAVLNENIQRPQRFDAKRQYAQELLQQIHLNTSKRAQERFEKEQEMTMNQVEAQRFKEMEESKRANDRQRSIEYRGMLEIQAKLKRMATEKETRSASEAYIGSRRNHSFNPITGESYEPWSNKPQMESVRDCEKTLANYGNFVIKARKPY